MESCPAPCVAGLRQWLPGHGRCAREPVVTATRAAAKVKLQISAHRTLSGRGAVDNRQRVTGWCEPRAGREGRTPGPPLLLCPLHRQPLRLCKRGSALRQTPLPGAPRRGGTEISLARSSTESPSALCAMSEQSGPQFFPLALARWKDPSFPHCTITPGTAWLSTALRCAALHCTALHCIALRCRPPER